MKKIAILGLHLNYGGVEASIVNQANMLCNDYEVELAITYKLLETPAFKIDSKVNIKYLTEFVPNREVFKKNLKEKHFIKAFKEGLKSIKILYLKNKSMKNYIKDSDADIIISSRLTFTKLLNKYAPKKAITIAEEHCHHNNNKKYINSLKKACTNIDYLLAVSQELTTFYTKILKNTKCIYMPNCIDYWPNNQSLLNNKKIVFVGRLSHEKGVLDLIDVFNLIYKKDNECSLDIIGDGTEFFKIKEKIENYSLEKCVTLHGFQSKEYINKLLLNSSLFLMCSYEESFGIVLVEAASYGVPAVSFDSAQGANEIIINDKSGYLIKNRNKEEMAKKTIDLLDNKEKLKEFGKEAKTNANRYSFKTIEKKLLKFIYDIQKNKK